MNRGVVALVLLAIGLLLLGGLLASVEPADLAPTRFETRSRIPTDDGSTDRLEEFVGAQTVNLVDEIELEIPEGSSLAWDGDTLNVIGNVTLKIPEGTEIENLTLVLPGNTRLLPTDGSEPGRRVLVLAPDTRVRLPEEHDGRAFRLPEGGELRDHMIPLREQEHGISQYELTTRQFSHLEAPLAVLEDEWNLRLGGDPHVELAAFAPLIDQMLDPERTYTNETLTLSTGDPPAEAKRDDDSPAGPANAALPAGPGAPPPWWAWTAVALVVSGIAAFTGIRQMPALLHKRPAPYHVELRLDERPEGLPLAVQGGHPRTLHVRLVPRSDPRDRRTHRRAETARVGLRVHLAGVGRLHKGRVGQETLPIALPPMPEGDHEITIRTQSSPLRRAHTTRALLRVAPWDQQVARDYHDLLESLRSTLPDAPALTPRQFRGLLEQIGAKDDGDDPHAIVKAFEESNYSPKVVGEEDWIPFALRVQRMRQALPKQRDRRQRPRRSRRSHAGRTPATHEPRPTG